MSTPFPPRSLEYTTFKVAIPTWFLVDNARRHMQGRCRPHFQDVDVMIVEQRQGGEPRMRVLVIINRPSDVYLEETFFKSPPPASETNTKQVHG